MLFLDLTLPRPEENLALDEALLDEVEHAEEPREVLRLWEPQRPFVVVGRSSSIAAEVNVPACAERDIPILRRASGGAAIVTGPGCLMYSVVLSYELRPHLRSIDAAHKFVLATLVAGLRPHVPGIVQRGTCDLALDDHKVSGNSLRCKRRAFLYHGTLLYAADLDLIESCLTMPPRQPDYRAGRAHQTFVANLPLDAATLRSALVSAWSAHAPYTDWPQALTQKLADEKYSHPKWNEIK
jgi:lipoate-protein ligase A